MTAWSHGVFFLFTNHTVVASVTGTWFLAGKVIFWISTWHDVKVFRSRRVWPFDLVASNPVRQWISNKPPTSHGLRSSTRWIYIRTYTRDKGIQYYLYSAFMCHLRPNNRILKRSSLPNFTKKLNYNSSQIRHSSPQKETNWPNYNSPMDPSTS